MTRKLFFLSERGQTLTQLVPGGHPKGKTPMGEEKKKNGQARPGVGKEGKLQKVPRRGANHNRPGCQGGNQIQLVHKKRKTAN